MFTLIKKTQNGKQTNVYSSYDRSKLEVELDRLNEIRKVLISKRLNFDRAVILINSKYKQGLFSKDSKISSLAFSAVESEIEKLELEMNYTMIQRETEFELTTNYYYIK